MNYKLYKGFDQRVCLEIAKNADNRQVVKDVSYAGFLHAHNPNSIYCERIDEKAFLLGQVQKGAFRIIGIGTHVDWRRKGLASLLLKRCEEYARENQLKKVKTRSLSGASFYAKRGYDIIGMRGGDYLLEKQLDY